MAKTSKRTEWAMKAIAAHTMGEYIECMKMSAMYARIGL